MLAEKIEKIAAEKAEKITKKEIKIKEEAEWNPTKPPKKPRKPRIKLKPSKNRDLNKNCVAISDRMSNQHHIHIIQDFTDDRRRFFIGRAHFCTTNLRIW